MTDQPGREPGIFMPAEKDRKVHAAGVGIIVDGVLSLTEVHHTSGVPDQPTLSLQQCGP